VSQSIRRSTTLQLYALVVLAISVGLLAFYAIENRDVLCAFKADLESRYEVTSLYIADVREGRKPLLDGITIADLEQDLRNRVATLEALSGLRC
jgi:hypothetical protein